MNALIVEDSPQLAERFRDIAAFAGLTVVAAQPDEASAIEACERFKVDVAIIDLQLAAGSGFGVIRHLRGRTPPVVMIVITNHAVPALKVASFEAGADYFLDKAKDMRTLETLLAEVRSRA